MCVPCTGQAWAPPQNPDTQCQGQGPHLHLCRPQTPQPAGFGGGCKAALSFLRTLQILPCCTPYLTHAAPAFGLSTADALHLLPKYPPAATSHQALRDILSSSPSPHHPPQNTGAHLCTSALLSNHPRHPPRVLTTWANHNTKPEAALGVAEMWQHPHPAPCPAMERV